MITFDELEAIALAKPEMKRAFDKVVKATVEYRREAAKKSGYFGKFDLKMSGLYALSLQARFITNSVPQAGTRLSAQDAAVVRDWINQTAITVEKGLKKSN
jgi:hypothetical protein